MIRMNSLFSWKSRLYARLPQASLQNMLTRKDHVSCTEIELSEDANDLHELGNMPNWRPKSFCWPVLTSVLLVHVIQLVLTITLVTIWFTNGEILHFKATNPGLLLFCNYFPLASVICVSIFWEILYLDVCRLEPFFQLSQPDGSTLKTSLSQEYATSFTLFVPLQALRCRPRRHIAVALSSTVYILAWTILPSTTVSMWHLTTNGDLTEILIKVSPAFVIASMVVLLCIIVFGSWLFVLLHRRRTGLFSDPAGIGGIAALVAESDVLDIFRNLRSYSTQSQIDKNIGDCRLILRHRPQQRNQYQICLLELHERDSASQDKTHRINRKEAHSWWLWGRTYITIIVLMMALPWTVFGVVLVAPTSISVMVSKLLVVVGNTISAAWWSNIHLNIAILAPFYRLTTNQKWFRELPNVYDPYCRLGERYRLILGSSRALDLDFSAGSAVTNVVHALRRTTRDWHVAHFAFCALMAHLTIIFTPTLLNTYELLPVLHLHSKGAYYVILVVIWCIVALQIILAIAFITAVLIVLLYKRKPFLPRKPYSLSSTVLYLCHNEDLMSSISGMSVVSKAARNKRLRLKNEQYGLGWIKDDNDQSCYIGIGKVDTILEAYMFSRPLLQNAR